MKTFKKFKEDFATSCKNADACSGEFKKLLESSNWCYTSKVIDTDILSEVPDKELLKANIYVKKENVKQSEGMAYYYSSTSEHYGSSTSEHYGSSYDSQYEVNIKSINDKAIIRERSTDKIYFKKGAFEIVEL